jgi:hypothetical protein
MVTFNKECLGPHFGRFFPSSSGHPGRKIDDKINEKIEIPFGLQKSTNLITKFMPSK